MSNILNVNKQNNDTSQQDWYSPEISKILFIVSIILSVSITVINFATFGIIITDKKLRTLPQYIYILNLATCDILVGCFIAPLNIPFVLLQEDGWIYGKVICKLWLLFDYVITCETSMAVVLIIYDRYLLVDNGVLYIQKQKPKKCILRSLSSWIWSISLYAPPILLWDLIVGYSVIPENHCDPQFIEVPVVSVILILIEAFFPLVLLFYYSYRFYVGLKKRQAVRKITAFNLMNFKNIDKTNNDKILKNTAVIIIVFFIFWFPYVIIYIIESMYHKVFEVQIAAEIIASFLYWSSVIHPFIFVYTNPKLKERIKLLVNNKYMRCKSCLKSHKAQVIPYHI